MSLDTAIETTTSDLTNSELSDRLLEAAADLFAEKGYEQAGVAEIARRAGVTTGAIYSRYTGKADLLQDAVKNHAPTEITRLLRAEDNDQSPKDILADIGEHLLDDLHESTGIFIEALVAARRDPDLAIVLHQLATQEDGEVAKILEAGQASGIIDQDLDNLALVRLAHAIGYGMNVTRLLGLELPTKDSWTEVINRVINSFAPTNENNSEINGEK
ncbi:MAG TPA: TetR/AcrR family transcriptional regulator [Acidimicrobiales bacterium]|jgi:AcrR family transcriptional regulator|nr:TetR/AcrR family transcriptional regulator [Acidimicrobiales bacterium]|tara:strand:+ start:49 stop:696 length:648 start_codon:yes stop_codon:yes gene_type:complete